MKKRTVTLFLVCGVLFFGLMGRIYYLTTRDDMVQAGDRQGSHTVTVATVRGTIYDTHLRPLVNARRENRYSVFPDTKTVSALTAGLEKAERQSILDRLTQNKPFVFTSERLLPLTDGLCVFSVPIRYETSRLASHVIGYIGSDGLHGVSGAEAVFDEALTQAIGRASVTYQVDGSGSWLVGGTVTKNDTLDKADAGVVLTIDREIQTIAERVADTSLTKGAVVIVSPENGHILAMVSRPDFDVTSLSEYLNRSDAPLINRALTNYNCGSVFKIVTSAAALEKGVSSDTVYECSGSVEVGDVTFRCHHALGHGTLDMFGGLAQSCNPYYIRLAAQIGGDTLYDMAQTLGFTREVTIAPNWSSDKANLPSLSSLQSPATVANLSFGQGALLATPVHVAQLVAAVVNQGKIVSPTILKGYVDEAGHLTASESAPPQYAFSATTAAILKQMMIEVVENGLGSGAKPDNGSAGGKTGTAQTGMIGENGVELLQNWFAGFYPAISPEYVVVVVSEDYESTGDTAAPVFREICEQLGKIRN